MQSTYTPNFTTYGYGVFSVVRGKTADKSGVQKLIEPDRHALQ